MRWTNLRVVAGCWLFAFALVADAQQLIIGSGARLDLGSSMVDAGCRDLQLAGLLDLGTGILRNVRDVLPGGSVRGGSGTLSLSGDLSLGTSLLAQSGTVRVTDGCGRTQSRIIGNHQFNRFVADTASGRTLVLPAGGTQFIASALELTGGVQRLLLRSSAPGSVSYLALAVTGTQLISRVDVQDVGAPITGQYLAPQLPSFSDSIDQGNTPRFFLGGDDAIVPVPTLSITGLLLLILSLVAFTALRPQLFSRGEA